MLKPKPVDSNNSEKSQNTYGVETIAVENAALDAAQQYRQFEDKNHRDMLDISQQFEKVVNYALARESFKERISLQDDIKMLQFPTDLLIGEKHCRIATELSAKMPSDRVEMLYDNLSRFLANGRKLLSEYALAKEKLHPKDCWTALDENRSKKVITWTSRLVKSFTFGEFRLSCLRTPSQTATCWFNATMLIDMSSLSRLTRC
jgi:hypothetical protein